MGRRAPRGRRRLRRVRVLLVEDDADTVEALRLLLEFEGFEITHAGTAREARAALAAPAVEFGAVLLDLSLPDKSGLELVEEIEALGLRPRAVVVMSAAPESLLQAAARRLNAVGYVRKPFETGVLLGMLHRASAGAR
ncbi:MAG TPA: response regulator [Vicinamibacteria bacterium]